MNSYFKFLSRNKLYLSVNVLGLALSLVFVIILSTYIKSELTADNFQEKADDIYVMTTEGFGVATAYRIGEQLKHRYPEIKNVCGIVPVSYYGDGYDVEVRGNKLKGTVLAADSSFFDMFSFKIVEGDRSKAIRTIREVYISESFARKSFGNEDAIGETISFNDSLSYFVGGVYEDIENSMIKDYDMIFNVENMAYFNSSTISPSYDNAGGAVLFFELNKGADLNEKAEDIVSFFKEGFWIFMNGITDSVSFIKMRDLYFMDGIEQHFFNSSDRDIVTTMILAAIIIFIFAVINYINLTVAQTGFRAKEMSTRRLYGSSRKMVIGRMILESSFLSLIAFILAYVIAYLAAPAASELLQKEIDLSFSVFGVSSSLIFVLILGTVSGLLPAIIVSRFSPLDVVKGRFTFKTKLTYSKIFITIQGVITVALIACSLFVGKQVNYLVNYDYGYNRDSILVCPGIYVEGKQSIFKERLLALPYVEKVGFSDGTPLNRGNNNTMKVEGIEDMISFQSFIMDYTSAEILGFETLVDNKVDNSIMWLNESSCKALGQNTDIVSFNAFGQERMVAGVFKDFVVGNLVQLNGVGTNQPILVMFDKDKQYSWNILIKINGDLSRARREIAAIYSEITEGNDFEGEYLDIQIRESYAAQRRMQSIMMIFTFIAVIISVLGLLAMSAYFTRQRLKEIAVRKSFGAMSSEVLWSVVLQFMKYSAISFVLAAPIVWFMMDKWLSSFAHRIDLSIWLIIAAGVFNLVISFLSIFWNSFIASRTNPIKSLQH